MIQVDMTVSAQLFSNVSRIVFTFDIKDNTLLLKSFIEGHISAQNLIEGEFL